MIDSSPASLLAVIAWLARSSATPLGGDITVVRGFPNSASGAFSRFLE